MTKANHIAVLTVPSPHSWIIINALVARFGPVHVIAEKREDKWVLFRKRMKRHGLLTVLGQAGFVMLQKLIDRRQKGRVAEIMRDMKLNANPNPDCEVYEVGSVNSMACRASLAMIKPDVVVVMGTRILGKETLSAISVPLINSHAGWNPCYRGQAGGYWALAHGDVDRAGVTIHLVDEGVDTGAILYQERFKATPKDSYSTYFSIQAGVARSLVIQAVEDAIAGQLKPFRSEADSRQFYHPTLWSYLYTGFRRGVW